MSAAASPDSPPLRALVTGAAGGLGRAVALGLAQRGVAVAIVDIDRAAGEATRQDCAALGPDAVFLEIDLLAADAAERAVRATVERLGGLDILVNNAGYGTGEAFLEMTAATWDRTLGLNLRALALACAAAGRHMAAQGRGRIINVTSPASRMALPNYTAYAASKAGVDAVTRAGAAALAKHGVLVNSIAPGMMDTPMQRSTEALFARLDGRDDMAAYLAERTARIPLGRRTSCEEVAEGVVWLALDAPAYLTAERLNLSGGLDKD
ncbi:MAG: SDR family oxidoreductase [Acidisphaera sp.]|nr:SDR family oxidoreductase [Acidisphaera sp.]